MKEKRGRGAGKGALAVEVPRQQERGDRVLSTGPGGRLFPTFSSAAEWNTTTNCSVVSPSRKAGKESRKCPGKSRSLIETREMWRRRGRISNAPGRRRNAFHPTCAHTPPRPHSPTTTASLPP